MHEQVATKKKTYTQEEAFKSSLDYFKGDELAARVWVNKYALKDSFGNIFEKNPNDMHRRCLLYTSTLYLCCIPALSSPLPAPTHCARGMPVR